MFIISNAVYLKTEVGPSMGWDVHVIFQGWPSSAGT